MLFFNTIYLFMLDNLLNTHTHTHTHTGLNNLSRVIYKKHFIYTRPAPFIIELCLLFFCVCVFPDASERNIRRTVSFFSFSKSFNVLKNIYY